jgi:endonuclease YncB( thermonuclease family)
LTQETELAQAQAELTTAKEALKNFESSSPFTQIDGYFVPLAHKLKYQELQRTVGESTTKAGSLSVRFQEARQKAAFEREQLQYQLKAVEAEFNKLKLKSPYTGLVKQIKISRGNGQELVAELKIQPDSQGTPEKPKADNQEPPSLKIDSPEQSGIKNQSSSELWQVLNVHDGDTIQVSRGNEKKRIRFACIDAPELNQPGGIRSRDNLRSLINKAGGRVRLDLITTDRYGRSVAEVWVGNQLAQSLQASTGNAYSYKQYQRDCPDWQSVTQAEQQAIANRLGVWGNPNSVRPWDWRRLERQQNSR